MKIIDLEKTEKTPEILLDSGKRVFRISGNCLPENIRNLSREVLEKLDAFYREQTAPSESEKDKGVFRVIFRLGYFNSASAKFIADVLILSADYAKKGCNLKIYWYYDVDDLDMLEAGEEMSQLVSVPMEFVAVVKE
ncbi:MAG: DUF1987 domain-containing protein [Bacteroidales bacterium]|nr:DUF1987 domain-containing protein [Bacteroidales bacterium]